MGVITVTFLERIKFESCMLVRLIRKISKVSHILYLPQFQDDFISRKENQNASRALLSSVQGDIVKKTPLKISDIETHPDLYSKESWKLEPLVTYSVFLSRDHV